MTVRTETLPKARAPCLNCICTTVEAAPQVIPVHWLIPKTLTILQELLVRGKPSYTVYYNNMDGISVGVWKLSFWLAIIFT